MSKFIGKSRISKSNDNEKIICTIKYLLSAATTEKDRARLLAVSSRNSSDWLHAFPIPSMGLKLDDNTLKISCALRLGATICQPHKCTRCGKDVDQTGTHGLSCNRQVGRHPRPRSTLDSSNPLI